MNEDIRASFVRLIDEDGMALGVKPVAEAIRLADERGMDLMEVAAQANPPVCRIINYSKFRYKKEKQLKDARKHQKGGQLKILRLRPRIGIHDLEIKIRQIERFLEARNKVKVTVFFHGREMERTALGSEVLGRIKDRLRETAVLEQDQHLVENNLFLIFAPKK